MKHFWFFSILLVLPALFTGVLVAQNVPSHPVTGDYPAVSREHDSIAASRVPLLLMPEIYRNRTLPPVTDNSANSYWPGIKDQYLFYSCQQYCGVAYTFGYEINRLRNQPGWYWENSYPAHFTWNFMNQGDRYTGVDFLQSFEAIRQQGHMTCNDFGPDTATSVLGWISGYDKYYCGMSNRLKKIYAIEVNSTEGINTLKNYLYDHLDGSAAGGIACFTTSSSTLSNMPVLPAGTPEEGKNVIVAWHLEPVHGMTVVGYNDSIRYDINNDGKYTNDTDITGDGIVDARDWEIGGFKIANSYGLWWTDDGFVYALYRSFALNYEDGGVWNNRVYLVEADSAYRPLLTLKVKLDHNQRNKIRILAGVSSDTLNQMPDHEMDFPIFNFQGGEHFMQGNDAVPGEKSIEFGLDVTPLLNYIPSGKPARFFLMVEERDPDQTGEGKIGQVSFIHYGNVIEEFPVTAQDVVIGDNNTTMVSVVAAVEKPDVRITTTHLPSYAPPQPEVAQLEASGGTQPYSWSLVEEYVKKISQTPAPAITGTSLMVPSATESFTAVGLPFSFPFYGKNFDSIYVNYFGFISFSPQNLPAPYITDETAMLRIFPLIVPSFSQQYTYIAGKNDGIWFQADAAHATIRWKTTVYGHNANSTNDFSLILYPDGRFGFCYGTMDNQGFVHTFYYGISRGDDLNWDIRTQWNANDISGKSFMYFPPVVPGKISLSGSGLLSVEEADSSVIYGLKIRVADEERITDTKELMLCSGLEISHELICGDDGKLKSGQPASLKMTVTNDGPQQIQDLSFRISSADSLLEITDSMYTIPVVNPGLPVTVPKAFSFSVPHSLPDGYPVMISLRAVSGSRSWKKELLFPVAGPEFLVDTPYILDGCNSKLDPGEVADLVVTVKNTGNHSGQDLQVGLSSADPGIAILSEPVVTIEKLNEYSSEEILFRVKASRGIQPGNNCQMHIQLADTTGPLHNSDFSLQIGTRPVALVNLSSSHASARAMMDALDSLHVSFDSISSLPFDYGRYASVFLILGTATSGSHSLNNSEGSFLAAYLRHGGNLYLESYFTWYYFNKTPLHPFLGYTTKKIPVYYYPQVSGVPETFSDSMLYTYQAPLNYAIFSIEPVSPAFATLVNDESPPKALEFAYEGSSYKTIGTMLEFSALADGLPPSSKTTLMQRWLEFFGLNIFGPYPYFHAAATEICRGKEASFTDDSFDNIRSWSWEFPGGTPAASSETNPVVRYDTGGKFDVRLTVSDGIRTETILKPQYIRVDQCAGTGPHPGSSALFRIFPNPSSDQLTVELSTATEGNCTIGLFDLTGRMVREIQRTVHDGNRISLNLSGLVKGLYFLRVRVGGLVSTLKLIKN